jgi:hypothetical protein
MPPYDPFNTRMAGKDQERMPQPIQGRSVPTTSIPVPLNVVPLNQQREAAPFARATFENMFAPQEESPLLQALIEALNPQAPGHLESMLAMQPQAQSMPSPAMGAMRPQQSMTSPRQGGGMQQSQSGLPSNWATPQASYSSRSPGGQGYTVSGNTVSWTTPSGKTFTAPRNV